MVLAQMRSCRSRLFYLMHLVCFGIKLWTQSMENKQEKLIIAAALDSFWTIIWINSVTHSSVFKHWQFWEHKVISGCSWWSQWDSLFLISLLSIESISPTSIPLLQKQLEAFKLVLPNAYSSWCSSSSSSASHQQPMYGQLIRLIFKGQQVLNFHSLSNGTN